MYTGSALVNNTLSTLEDARIPLTDRGFLFGHAVFETLLVLDGQVVFWDEHMERLAHGCSRARISLPDSGELWKMASLVVRHNISQSRTTSPKMQLRLMVSGGTEAGLWSPGTSALKPNVTLFCRNIPGPSPQMMREGVTLRIVDDTRSPALLDVKSNGYLPALLAFAEASESGFDDALYRNARGELTEATTANILWLTPGGRVHTTPTLGRCLAGTTLVGLRRGLERAGECLGESVIRESDLGTLSGMAIVSATRGAVPVRAVGATRFDLEATRDRIAILNELLATEQRRFARALPRDDVAPE